MSMRSSFTLPMPIIASVDALDPYLVRVTWVDGLRAGKTEIVDLAPTIESLKFFRPLRGNPDLFNAVGIRDGGHAIGWGNPDLELEMASTTVERLAEETMTAQDFRDFV